MLSNFLIQVIVLLLPTQLGLHFWPSFSRVAGIKIDYLSPTLYLIDLILILLVMLNIKALSSFYNKYRKHLIIFTLFASANTLLGISPLNSLFWWLRFCLYISVFFVFRLHKIRWNQIKTPLLYGTALVVILETLQLYFQSSLGGIFYYFGERLYSNSTSGLGRFNLFGLEVLRPTSTFSHANSLAGYLLVVFYLFSKKPSKPWHKLIPFIGILLTFSKTAIVYLALIIFSISPQTIIYLSIILTISQPILENLPIRWQSISDRQFYYSYLKSILKMNPLIGVGLGNFIPALGTLLPGSFLTPSKLQPIHNLPILVLSETGLLGGLIITLTLLKKNVLRIITKPLVLGLLSLVLFTGVFDHYTWTLPQNKLILLIALSIMI